MSPRSSERDEHTVVAVNGPNVAGIAQRVATEQEALGDVFDLADGTQLVVYVGRDPI